MKKSLFRKLYNVLAGMEEDTKVAEVVTEEIAEVAESKKRGRKKKGE